MQEKHVGVLYVSVKIYPTMEFFAASLSTDVWKET